MALSSMIVSQDSQEVSVFECILGGLHMDVDVETEPGRAWDRLTKTKVDALIVDCDLDNIENLLRKLRDQADENRRPVVILSGSNPQNLVAREAMFVVEKPVSVEKAVHTISAARNLILQGRLRYHREALDAPVTLSWPPKNQLSAHLLNLSQGGLRVRLQKPAALKDAVEVNFVLPGTNISLEARGEVAWTDRQGNAGIRLVHMSNPMRRDLQLWLERQYFQASAARH